MVETLQTPGAAATFDPEKFRATTRTQWEAAAPAWDRWSPLLARWLGAVKARGEVGPLRWEDGCLTADITLDLLRGDGEPLVLVERDGGWWLDPELLDGVPGAGAGFTTSQPTPAPPNVCASVVPVTVPGTGLSVMTGGLAALVLYTALPSTMRGSVMLHCTGLSNRPTRALVAESVTRNAKLAITGWP